VPSSPLTQPRGSPESAKWPMWTWISRKLAGEVAVSKAWP